MIIQLETHSNDLNYTSINAQKIDDTLKSTIPCNLQDIIRAKQYFSKFFNFQKTNIKHTIQHNFSIFSATINRECAKC